MKKYQKPLLEVAEFRGMSVMSLISPADDIQGNPGGGTNDPGGFGTGAPMRWI